jgi:hypothetical protein
MIADIEERYDETRQLRAFKFGAGVVAVNKVSQYRRPAHLAAAREQISANLRNSSREESSQDHGSQDGDRSGTVFDSHCSRFTAINRRRPGGRCEF